MTTIDTANKERKELKRALIMFFDNMVSATDFWDQVLIAKLLRPLVENTVVYMTLKRWFDTEHGASVAMYFEHIDKSAREMLIDFIFDTDPDVRRKGSKGRQDIKSAIYNGYYALGSYREAKREYDLVILVAFALALSDIDMTIKFKLWADHKFGPFVEIQNGELICTSADMNEEELNVWASEEAVKANREVAEIDYYNYS